MFKCEAYVSFFLPNTGLSDWLQPPTLAAGAGAQKPTTTLTLYNCCRPFPPPVQYLGRDGDIARMVALRRSVHGGEW